MPTRSLPFAIAVASAVATWIFGLWIRLGDLAFFVALVALAAAFWLAKAVIKTIGAW